jgi:hypothetical protein
MPNYKIEAVETAKSKIPLKACMKKGILPRFPFSMMISGRSGSGKTNLLVNLLTRKEFLKHFFHYVCIYSPTAGEYDDSYKSLNLPPENFRNDFSEQDLEDLIESRKELIKKKGIEYVAKNCRVLIILDDVIANRDFLNSPQALKMFALLRHYLVSVIVLMQTYNKLPKALRNNANAIMIFPSNRSEVEVLMDELTPPNLSKKQFQKVIEDATDERYSFLYINNHADPDIRLRINLDEVIELIDYKK